MLGSEPKESPPAMTSGESILRILEEDATVEAALHFVHIVADYLAGSKEVEQRVSSALPPRDLAERFRSLPPRHGLPLSDVAALLRANLIPDSTWLWHPMSMGHQVAAPLPVAVWTESVIAALNQSLGVWEMSPVATIIETEVIRWMCGLAGFGPGSGGTFTSGGTEANFAALLAARNASLPRAWTEGVGNRSAVILCGEHAHYSVIRAAGQLGLGTQSVVVIPSDQLRMDVAALEQRVHEFVSADVPIMAVVAAACSTATGSFDDLTYIGELCERFGIWLHVDAAHGGSALLSDAHRSRLRGIERARSITWDPHKMMLMPLSAGMLLVRDLSELEGAFAQSAPYLFNASRNTESEYRWDQGVRSFMCSRRADALKVWVALQRYGTEGFGRLYDHLCMTARDLHHLLRMHGSFDVFHEPEANILCFRYVGTGLGTAERLNLLNRKLKQRLDEDGGALITESFLNGRWVLRVTIMNPRTTRRHLEMLVSKLGELGRELELEAEPSEPDPSHSASHGG